MRDVIKRAWAFLLPLLAISIIFPACGRERQRTKVVILGFDGANWETIDPLIERGELEFLRQFKETGSWGYLRTFKPTKSPVIWTSIATGKSMVKHGILDFTYIEENQIQVPYSNSERRVPSIWEILNAYDRRAVVINWFVTYPPDKINGVMVSNRFRRAPLLGEQRFDRVRDSVYPEHFFDALKEFVTPIHSNLLLGNELPDVAEIYKGIHAGESPEDVPVMGDYLTYVLQEELIENVSRHLYETEEFDFFAAYFRLPDLVQHFVLELVDQRKIDEYLTVLDGGELSERQEMEFEEMVSSALGPFYRYMERIIERFTTMEKYKDAYFIIVSDHGFKLHSGGYDHYHIPDEYPAPDGIFLMKGPDVKTGMVSSISVYDIAPTILYLYDLPAGKDMDGNPVTEIFRFEREVEYVSYSNEMIDTIQRVRDRGIDEQTLEELRSLGYIK